MKRKTFEDSKLETYILNGLDEKDKRKNFMVQT